MANENGVVIVGGSIAGYNVARRLRKDCYGDNITMIDQKNTLPYDRAELSTDWMLDTEETTPPLFQKKEFFSESNIIVKLNTRVTKLNPEGKTVITDTDEIIPYDKLVLATGSSLRRLNAPGEDAHGVFYLRDYEDALAIKEWSKEIKELVIVGAGFIGLEMAATFSQLDLNVTVIEYDDHPLGKILGKEASQYFMKMHEDHGVRFITGEGAKEFRKDKEGNLTSVITTSGQEITSQMAIIGVGVRANLSLHHTDLETDEGIIVNQYGETSLPNVYAVGDVANWPYKGEIIHLTHWEHAYNHGQTIAKNIIEPKSHPYNVRPYFWTDQYDQTFERLGHAVTWDKIIRRGSLENREFTLAYVDENNYPLAILFANNGDGRKEVAKLMDKREAIDETSFRDENNPL